MRVSWVCMTRTRKGQVASLAIFWVQMIILTLALVFGATYTISLFLNLTPVSILLYPIVIQLVSVFRIMIYLGIGLVIVLGYYRRLTRRRKPVDQSLKDRLRLLVSQTQQLMKMEKPSRPFILPRSSNAANAGRGRIIVGEQLVQQMDNQELAGIIGHEFAHGIRHHVLIKVLLFPSVIGLVIGLYLVTQSVPNGIVLYWTAFAGIIFAEMLLSWKLEYSADHLSAERLGKDPMIRALTYLREIHYDGPSFTHPPLSRRINRLSADRNLQETIAEVAILPTTPPRPDGENAPDNRVSIDKVKPVEFRSPVYEAPKFRICPICGVQVPFGKMKCNACGTTLR